MMYPWRRVFKSLFAHDRSRGQVYTLRERDGKGEPVTITQLGIRLHECGAEWQEQRKLLSALLEMLEDEMPVLPPAHATPPERGAVSSSPSCCFPVCGRTCRRTTGPITPCITGLNNCSHC